MREYENRVNSKAPVLTPSEIHFCCARHNPDAKTFTRSPAAPPPGPGSTSLIFLNPSFLCHISERKSHKCLSSERNEDGKGSHKRVKRTLVMERSLCSLTDH